MMFEKAKKIEKTHDKSKKFDKKKDLKERDQFGTWWHGSVDFPPLEVACDHVKVSCMMKNRLKFAG